MPLLYVFGKRAPLAKELEAPIALEKADVVFAESPSATNASMPGTLPSTYTVVPETQRHPVTPTRRTVASLRDSREHVRTVDCLTSHPASTMTRKKADLGLRNDRSAPRPDRAGTPDVLMQLETVDDSIQRELERSRISHPPEHGASDVRKYSMDDEMDWEIEATQLLVEPQSLQKRLVHLQVSSTPCLLGLEPDARVVSSGLWMAGTQPFDAPIHLDEIGKATSPQLINIAKDDTPIDCDIKLRGPSTASPKMSRVIEASGDTTVEGILPSSQDLPNPFLAILAKSKASPKPAVTPSSAFKATTDAVSAKDAAGSWPPKTPSSPPKAASLAKSARTSSHTRTPTTASKPTATRSSSRIRAMEGTPKTSKKTPSRTASKARMRVTKQSLSSKSDESASRKKPDKRRSKGQVKDDMAAIKPVDCSALYGQHLLPDMLVWAPHGNPSIPATYYSPARLMCNVSRRRGLWKVRSLDHKKRAEGEYVKDDEAIVPADHLCPIGVGLATGAAIYRRKRLDGVALATFLSWTAPVDAGEQLVRIREADGMPVTVKLKRLLLDREAFLAKRTLWLSPAAPTLPEMVDQQDGMPIFTSIRFVLSRSTQNSWLEECRKLIVSNGGIVLDAVPSDGLFTLVMREFKRTAKFFQALALGAPIVGPHWLAACIRNRALVSWTEHLPLNTPEIKAIGTPRTLLLGKTACIEPRIASEWTPIVAALGAQIDRGTVRAGKGDAVVIDAESIEWLIECLFANRLY